MLLRAFAKINLDLRVGHLREDGYHEVRTVLQTIDWYDEIRMTVADRFEFAATGVAADETNLVARSVREFERATGKPAGVRIELSKSIPIGAGLGGGSADAAVTVMGLQRLTGIRLEEAALFQCLRALGSDVPFFAIGGRALGVGRGEEVSPLEDEPGPEYHLVIVNPGVTISTAEAYSWLTSSDRSNRIKGFRAQQISGSGPEEGGNDFESAVFQRYPKLEAIRNELLDLGAFRASLSGSGSAIFGMFRRKEDAREAGANLSGRFSVRVSRPLSRAEYLNEVFASGD